jgi:hypothetical protein
MKPKTIEINTFETIYVESTHSFHEVETDISFALYLKPEDDTYGEPHQCEICEEQVGWIDTDTFLPYTRGINDVVLCLQHARDEVSEMLGAELVPRDAANPTSDPVL